MPLRTTRAPNVGTSTVQTPYGRTGSSTGLVWISRGSPAACQVSEISSSDVVSVSVQKSRKSPVRENSASITGIVVSFSSAFSMPCTVPCSQRAMAMLSE